MREEAGLDPRHSRARLLAGAPDLDERPFYAAGRLDVVAEPERDHFGRPGEERVVELVEPELVLERALEPGPVRTSRPWAS